MSERIAYLSQSQMNLVERGAGIPLRSQRIAQYEQNARELERKYEWRSTGPGAQFTRQQNPYQGASLIKGEVSALGALNGALVYAASFPELGGLYIKDTLDPNAPEPLILSDRGIAILDLHAHKDQLALALRSIRQEVHIALVDSGGLGLREITEGDTIDLAPRFSPDGRLLHYASAGYGRTQDGHILDVGPMAVMELDMQSGALTERFSDAAYDFLRPKMGPDGALYLIRRPYKSRRVKRRTTLREQAQIVKSVAGGFSMLARMFAGKPPKKTDPAAGSSAAANANLDEETLIDGVALKVEQIRQQNQQRGEKYPGAAPQDWVLMRMRNGELELVKGGVIDYEFSEGGILYTNGHHILRLSSDGSEQPLAKDKLITRIAVF